jgi:hypothetical protein
MKKISYVTITLILFVSFSCKKTYEIPDSDVVINEVMPVNSTTIADQNGEYDDWIELYNLSSVSIDLSGYFLTDSKKNLSKWRFPSGTVIVATSYLIVWADEDTTQAGLHTNFKLSSAGEDVILSKPDNTMTDKVTYPDQTLQLSYSRVPNGKGDFIWQTPTYNISNGAR